MRYSSYGYQDQRITQIKERLDYIVSKIGYELPKAHPFNDQGFYEKVDSIDRKIDELEELIRWMS